MPEITLDGSTRAHALGDGYRISIPDLAATVNATDGDARSRGFFDEPLDSLLEDAGLSRAKVVRIDPKPSGARAMGDGARTVSLDVPRTAGNGSIVLLEDEATGALSWHLPNGGGAGESGSNTRALKAAKRTRAKSSRAKTLERGRGARGAAAADHFEIPLLLSSGSENTRAFGKLKGAIIKIFTYPLAKVVKGYVRKWETNNRPYLVRAFGPDDYTDGRKDFPALDNAGWQRLASGRALLFVHGTFSTATAGFGGIPMPVMQALSQHYEGRTFAFNHFTLSDDPAQNAAWLLDQIPEGISLDVDIICHSRGGLVSREIAAQGARRGLNVRKIVFGAAVNNGTVLANPDHMLQLLDRYTTIAKLLPGTAQLVVDAVVTTLEVIAKGLLPELAGISAMDPNGDYLTRTNVPGETAVEGYAIASNFEPPAGTAWHALTRLKDMAVDRVFQGDGNDLVVPYEGVYSRPTAPGFPIPASRCLFFGDHQSGNDGVIHTEVFKEPRTGEALLSWLGAESATRAAVTMRADAATGMSAGAAAGAANVASRAKTPELTVEEMEALRPHVVNLSEGKFKPRGKYSTTPADVDAIFETHLPNWMGRGGGGAGKPLRIVVWAHGGLINEQDGLAIAKKHVDWWKANGVYPIYFVWETGLTDALRVILEGVRNRIPGMGTRGFASDLTDKLVENGVRALGGPKVWGAMKTNAELCSARDGGAYYVAQRLRDFCKANPKTELHAVGHSAGSIFHSYFLPAARSLDVPVFASLQLLAPAIRMDEFKARIMPLVGARKAVRTARMFTMRDAQELEDTCIGIYRKSLLYLIYHALEPQKETPILGLEANVMEEPDVRQFFTPASGGPASAVWSVTSSAVSIPNATRATSHGGFDDESITMSSVAAQVLGTSKPVVEYPGSRATSDDWPEAREWLRGFERTGGFAPNPAIAAVGAGISVVTEAHGGNGANGSASSSIIAAPAIVVPGGKRKALCIGIDAYRGHELHGCVNDATNWAKAFNNLGFDTAFIRDKDATIEGILQSVRKLVSDARSGDVLAIQYAGHGYQLSDIDQDETEGDGMDEALVPYDFEAGAFILDDDIRREFSAIKPGVSLTCFLDCCHSGTATRVFASSNPANDEIRSIRMTGTPRYLKTDRDERIALEEAHASFRADLARGRTLSRASGFGRESMQWINFSACKSEEEALEHAGAGDFTTHALSILNGKRAPLTNEAFHDMVVGKFGERRAQTPVLDCKESDKSTLLLGGIGVPVAV